MRIQDQYWQRTGTGKWQIARQHLVAAVPRDDALHVHFTSATALPRKVPMTIASSVNPKLSSYLRAAPGAARFLGIIVMDFPSPALCGLVLRRNGQGLDPCRAVRQDAVDRAVAVEYIDNLQCELMCASARADHAVENAREDTQSHVHRLAYVYCRLVVEHAVADASMSATDDFYLPDELPAEATHAPAAASRAGARSSPAPELPLPVASPGGPPRRAPCEKTPPKAPRRGLLRRFRKLGSCFVPRREPCEVSLSRQNSSPSDPRSPGGAPADCGSARASRLEDLECELEAAATRASAAGLALERAELGADGQPRGHEELSTRVRRLAEVYVRLLVERSTAADALLGRPPEQLSMGDDGPASSSQEVSPGRSACASACRGDLLASDDGGVAASDAGSDESLEDSPGIMSDNLDQAGGWASDPERADAYD